MNDRIKLLAEQAGINIYPISITGSTADFEKFAELMIKEFIDVVENLAPMYDDYRDQIEDRFRRDCISQVKHRFIWSDKE